MPSPFPGMDPYLEAPDLWPDCHDRLAGGISAELNRRLPAPYYARVSSRPEVGIVEEEGETTRVIVPDVAVIRRDRAAPEAGLAVVERPRREVSASFEVEMADEPILHRFVEIRDAKGGHRLVTVIEILSPSNKRPGPDREAYARKQRAVLESDANLVEVDLLRSGRRVLPDDRLATIIDGRGSRSAYVVLVSPAWRRGEVAFGYRIYPARLREPLPCVGIPLREDVPDVPLDLQYVFDRLYDDGPYRRGAVDYTRPPDPPLEGDDAAWAEGLVRATGGGD